MSRLLLAVLSVACCATLASAADLGSARDHYKKALHAFDSGAYNRAADEYTLAYQASDDPLLLYNIAVALRLSNHPQQSLRAYRMYLKRLPQADNRRECEAAIAALLAPAPSPSPAPSTTAADSR